MAMVNGVLEVARAPSGEELVGTAVDLISGGSNVDAQLLPSVQETDFDDEDVQRLQALSDLRWSGVGEDAAPENKKHKKKENV